MEETPPRWDLSDLYKSISDPKIEEDIRACEENVLRLRSTYKNTIDTNSQKEHVLQALSLYAQILESVHILQSYASLEHAIHQTDQKYGAFRQSISTWATGILNQCLFLELELAHLDETILKTFISDPDFKDSKHFLERQLAFKSHYLSEEKEQILREKALTGREALVRLYDQASSRQTFEITVDGKTKKIHQAEVLHLMTNSDREIRKTTSAAFSEKLRNDAEYPTFIINMISQDLSTDVEHRKFPSAEAMRHLDNEVDQHIVDALSNTVEQHYNLAQDYYVIKKHILGLETLYEYDKYAPIKKIKREFSFSEGKEIILSAFHDFSPRFAEIATLFFERNWIDAKSFPGKRGGAFCSYVSPSTHPYVLMSYKNKVMDVVTLAHELGHAINGYLAREQSILHFDWPLTLAETASVFCERLVFESLATQLSEEEKISLYSTNIEGIIAKVFRQISMYRFEKAFHAARKEKGELSTGAINTIWRDSQHSLYGHSLTLTPDEDIRWSYVPHFIHTPFYVYAYAFGELMTLALYDIYKTEGKDFVEKYTKLLAAGGSASPQELLSMFNVDIHDPSFWNKGIEEADKAVKELHALAK